ncbi:MAG: TPM domain-containing protein [Methylophilaceae bacterium]
MKNRNRFSRLFEHLFSHPWQVRRYFCDIGLNAIEQAITESERRHTGEIRFVVETGLDVYEVLLNKTPHKRAIELFSHLGMWDTEHNNGVLVYLMLADQDIEIVADRGIDRHVGQARWRAICHEVEARFKRGEFEGGVLQGIAEISAELEKYFPENGLADSNSRKKNEISNKPLIL